LDSISLMASRTFTAEECHRINSDASHNIRPRGIAAPNAFGPPRTFNIEHPISKNEVARESREYTRKKFQEKKIIRVNSRYSRGRSAFLPVCPVSYRRTGITDAGYSSIRVIRCLPRRSLARRRVIRGSPTFTSCTPGLRAKPASAGYALLPTPGYG